MPGGVGGFTRVRLEWESVAQVSQFGPCTRISRSRDVFNTSFKRSARAHLSDACCVFKINRVKYKESRATKQTRIAETRHTRKVIFGESQPPDLTT